jgi:four helix bundle protein
MGSVEKVYDLEERTFLFAKNVRGFVKELDKSIWNKEDIKQVTRSSGSVAANYIEANEKLGERDFLMRIRICKKEVKETVLWLRLIDIETEGLEKNRITLIEEASELKNIFGAIYKNSINKSKT